MTYSLNTLNAHSASTTEAAGPRSLWSRFAQEIFLMLGALVLMMVGLALWSYQPQDAAWSTSGQGAAVKNWMGTTGAWVADVAYFLFGYSVWWCLAAGVRAWLVALARWIRGPVDEEPLAVTPFCQHRAFVSVSYTHLRAHET